MILLLIFLSIFIGLNIRYSVIAYSILAIVFLIFIFVKYKKRILILCSIFLASSIGISFINISHEQSSYSGMVIEAKDNYYIFSSKLERLYVYEKDHQYEIGDFLTLTGNKTELKMTSLESEFDFKDYLNKKGIYSQLYPDQTNVNFLNPIRLRTYKNEILENYSDDTASLIKSIFSGGGQSEIKTDLSYLHLSRLLSLSGVYLYVILKGITYLLSFKMKEKWAKITAITLLSPYLFFSFPKFSVIRIFFVFILRWINDYLLKKKLSYLSILSISAIVFLMLDYHNAYQDSFILGFFMPLFLYFTNNSLLVKSKIKKKALNAILVFAFMIPFELKFYQSINLLAYPLQIIFTPIFVIYGMFSIFVFFKIPMMTMMDGYTDFIKNSLNVFTRACININIPSFQYGLEIAYFFLLIILLYFISTKHKPMYSLLSLLCVCLGFVYIVPVKNTFTSEVSFINVGQGDSCLIRIGNSVAMIDTGGSLTKDIANDVLIPYLKRKRIYNIDLLITTHDDIDHNGAMSSLSKYYKINTYINSYKSFPISFKGLTFTNYNIYSDLWNEDNAKSLVISFNLSSNHYLIMGDAPKSIETAIIKDYPNLKVDVLKVGHHGSDTSSSNDFIKSIQPKYGIVSVGKNSYGHPSSKVLNILKNNNVLIKRTDQEGTISFT